MMMMSLLVLHLCKDVVVLVVNYDGTEDKQYSIGPHIGSLNSSCLSMTGLVMPVS